jgi:hypothetical protein
MALNGWRVSEVPFGGILASALSADPGPDRGRCRQTFNRLLAEIRTSSPFQLLSYFGDSPDSNFFTPARTLPHQWGGKGEIVDKSGIIPARSFTLTRSLSRPGRGRNLAIDIKKPIPFLEMGSQFSSDHMPTLFIV